MISLNWNYWNLSKFYFCWTNNFFSMTRVHLGTSSYLQALAGSCKYLQVLLGSSKHFKVH